MTDEQVTQSNGITQPRSCRCGCGGALRVATAKSDYPYRFFLPYHWQRLPQHHPARTARGRRMLTRTVGMRGSGEP